MVRVTNAHVVSDGWLLLDFDNQERKFVDIKPVMKGILKQLEDPQFFEQVHVDRELGTVTWPGELDLDPDNLYRQGIDANVAVMTLAQRKKETGRSLERA